MVFRFKLMPTMGVHRDQNLPESRGKYETHLRHLLLIINLPEMNDSISLVEKLTDEEIFQ
jgi:hypothetical protein